jgi:pimeloyl-ACP methyl ester carboxylesterase
MPRAHTTPDGAVESADGTTIAYRSVGSGPGVVVIPGVLSMAEDYDSFAEALADRFTVHTVQRRGRGHSGPQGEHYDIARECEDVAAMCARTGARHLVGHSYGGLIALQSARHDQTLTKVAVYEPGVSVDGLIPTTWMPRYRRLLTERRYLDALAYFSVATGPDRARTTPLWLMKAILPLAIRKEHRHMMYGLLAANVREHEAIARLDGSTEDYREVSVPVLLMSGGKSGLPYVAPAIERLSEVLPAATTRVFPRLDHFGPDRTGPVEVARAVGEFFLV